MIRRNEGFFGEIEWCNRRNFDVDDIFCFNDKSLTVDHWPTQCSRLVLGHDLNRTPRRHGTKIFSDFWSIKDVGDDDVNFRKMWNVRGRRHPAEAIY